MHPSVGLLARQRGALAEAAALRAGAALGRPAQGSAGIHRAHRGAGRRAVQMDRRRARPRRHCVAARGCICEALSPCFMALQRVRIAWSFTAREDCMVIYSPSRWLQRCTRSLLYAETPPGRPRLCNAAAGCACMPLQHARRAADLIKPKATQHTFVLSQAGAGLIHTLDGGQRARTALRKPQLRRRPARRPEPEVGHEAPAARRDA